MKKLLLLIVAFTLSFSLFAEKKSDLRILYVGGSSDYQESTPETVADRMTAFENYLKEYFKTVSVIKEEDYLVKMSADYDVTIFDGKIPAVSSRKITKNSDGSDKDYYREKRLNEDFDYPAIFIAEQGETIGRAIGTKTDWYCLCLDAYAHHFNAEHPIFKGPYKVKMTIEERPTPEDAFHYKYYYDGQIPATLPMWRVQTKGYMTDEGFRVGMVSRPWGFLDSPETEMISSGVCAKTLDAVSIGRHGNFFFWGFSASPKFMTDEAKAVFANAVVYTASLKGQHIIARKYYDRAATKEYIKELNYLTTDNAYKERIEMEKVFYANQAEIRVKVAEKQKKGEKLTSYETQLMSYPAQEYIPQSYDAYIENQMRGYYETFGTDVEAFHSFLNDNKPYLYGAAMFYNLIVDEDVKSLQIPNTDKRVLDAAISLWESGKDVEKARRILNRYTLCTFETPQQWRKWYDSNKDRLFFSQAGGWYFLVDTMDQTVPGNDYVAKGIYDAASGIILSETNDNEPVAVGAAMTVLPGGSQYVIVKVKIRNGYHIYATVSERDPYIKTSVSLSLPEGYTSGTIRNPQYEYFNESGTTQYTGEKLFAIPVEGVGEGTIKVLCEYQCCDSQICFSPAEKEIELKTICFSMR